MGPRSNKRRRSAGLAVGTAALLCVAGYAMAADTVFIDGDTAVAAPNLAYGGGGRDCSTRGQAVGGEIVVNYNGAGGGHFQAGEPLTVTVTAPAGVHTSVSGSPQVPSDWDSNDDSFAIPFSTTVDASIGDGAYQAEMAVRGDTSGYSAGSDSGSGKPRFVVNVSCSGGGGGTTNHAPSLTVASATASVDEGSEVANSGTYSDADGDAVALAASYGTVVKDPNSSPGTWSWSATPDDGPADSQNVTITASDGTLEGTVSFGLTVANVAPTILSITPNVSPVLTGQNVTFTGSASDPSNADTTAGFQWAWNGGLFGAAGANTFTTSFTTCGPHTVSAQARDKDLGVSASATSSAVSTYDGRYLPPLNEGLYNAVQKGSVVPVKIAIGCNGTPLTGLTPAIQLLSGDIDPSTDPGDSTLNVTTASVSAADTTGVMRAIDGGYIYNLSVPAGSAGALYTVRVRPFGASGGAMYVVLKIRK